MNYISENSLVQAVSSRKLSKNHIKILNHAIDAGSRLSTYQFSYETIAKDLSLSVSTVKRTFNSFISLGIISKVCRAKDFNTNIIKVNPVIYKYAVLLRKRFWSLRKIAIKNIMFSPEVNKPQNPLQQTNELPLYRRVLNIPRKYILLLQEGRKSRVKPDTGHFKLNKIQESKLVNEVGTLIISPTLQEITKMLRLTKVGQLKLMAFTDEVLKIGWKDCKAQSYLRDPYHWLIAHMEKYCTDHKVRTDWAIFYTLLKRYGVTDNKKYFFDRPTPGSNNHSPQVKSVAMSQPRWKTLLANGPQVAHPLFAKEFAQKLLNDCV